MQLPQQRATWVQAGVAFESQPSHYQRLGGPKDQANRPAGSLGKLANAQGATVLGEPYEQPQKLARVLGQLARLVRQRRCQQRHNSPFVLTYRRP
ncbi:MAG: hypothetical protein ACK5O3_11630 [Burkholderiales bacterium]